MFRSRLGVGLTIAEERSRSACVFFVHLGEVMSHLSQRARTHQYIRRLERGTVHVVDPIFPQHL